MRVFVTGASGVIGTRLVPKLIDRGHHVIGTTRTPEGTARLKALGAEPVALDLLDREAVVKAVVASNPDAIVHEATALKGLSDFKHFDRSFHDTNRLRTEGTDALLAAAEQAGARRFVTQSFAGFRHERRGSMVKTEDDPLDANPPRAASESFAAMRYLDERATEFGGITLRYGVFYGDRDNALVEAVRQRKFPTVGDGGGVWSFIHLDDAAAATVIALEREGPGVYNIVDDEPAPTREWLPVLAETVGAKPPQRFPRLVARIFAGETPVMMGTEVRGVSNAKAKRELGWSPEYTSWRHGFVEAYGSTEPGVPAPSLTAVNGLSRGRERVSARR